MDLRQLLDAIDDADGTLAVDGAELVVRLRPSVLAELGPAITEHRDTLVAIALGRRTGHVPAFCEGCGEVTMTAAKTASGGPRSGIHEADGPFDKWPTCRMTPSCGGATQHGTPLARCHPRPVDLAGVAAMPAPPTQARPPKRTDPRHLFGPRQPWPPPAPRPTPDPRTLPPVGHTPPHRPMHGPPDPDSALTRWAAALTGADRAAIHTTRTANLGDEETTRCPATTTPLTSETQRSPAHGTKAACADPTSP